jgi:hypothetical protein
MRKSDPLLKVCFFFNFQKIATAKPENVSLPPALQIEMAEFFEVPSRSARAPHWEGLGKERVLREVVGSAGGATIRTAHVPEYLLFALAREMELGDAHVQQVTPGDDARAPWEQHVFMKLRVMLASDRAPLECAERATRALVEACDRLDERLTRLQLVLEEVTWDPCESEESSLSLDAGARRAV